MTSSNTMTAVTGRNHAQSMADKTSDVAILLGELAVKAQEVSAGPATTLDKLNTRFDELKLSISDEFPRLGTKEADTNGYSEDYKDTKKTDDGHKDVNANFFTDYIDRTDFGKQCDFIASQCSLALKNAQDTKVEQAYREMSRPELDAERTRANNAKSKARGYIRKAIGCYWVIYDLAQITGADEKPVVTIEFKDNFEKSSVPFILVDETRRNFYQPVAVSDMMKFKVKDAVAKGGNLYDALLAQLKRDTNREGAKNLYPAATTVDMVLNAMLVVANFFDDKDKQNAFLKQMGQPKGGAELIRTLGDTKSRLNNYWNNSLQVKYERMLAKDVENSDDDKPAEVPALAKAS